MIPTRERYGRAAESDFDACSLFAAADHRVVERFRGCGQELVVLSEAEVILRGPGGKRDLLEVDRQAAARTLCDVARVGREPVRDVDERVGARSETAAVFEPQRRAGVTALAERGAGRPEGAGDHEQVARTCSASPRDSVRAAYRRDRDREGL